MGYYNRPGFGNPGFAMETVYTSNTIEEDAVLFLLYSILQLCLLSVFISFINSEHDLVYHSRNFKNKLPKEQGDQLIH